MTINEYQNLAMKTRNPALSQKDTLINSVMGLCGESGEAIEITPEEEAAPAPDEETPDYFQQFEKAVYQAEQPEEDAIPAYEDGDDAPSFRF